MLEIILVSLGLRFFVIDFISTEGIREWLIKKHRLIAKWFGCAFCNGFWIGGFVTICFQGLSLHVLWYCLAIGYISFLIDLVQKKLIK